MEMADLNTVYEPARAAILLHPLRLRILELARVPASASELAAQLGLPRQKGSSRESGARPPKDAARSTTALPPPACGS